MSIKVQIYDQTYHVAGDLAPAYVEELAQHVAAKRRAIARATGTVDSVKVAVLAALAIADELYAERTGGAAQSTDEIRERAKRCLKLVERALDRPA